MNNKEYLVRESEIIKKINEVNNRLASQKIVIQYSVYNQNGIASKLEKTDLYGTDVTTSIFTRNHRCDSQYMIDGVVKANKIKNEIEIEENFNKKITDIELASIDELVGFFGNMDNHEKLGLGYENKYQLTYKGQNENGQNVEIKAIYGSQNDYSIRTSVVKANVDGTITKVYIDKKANIENGNVNEKVVKHGLETKDPENYSLIEKKILNDGSMKFKVNYLSGKASKYSIEANDEAFNDICSISFGELQNNYSEFGGMIENASGKLACRVLDNGEIVKPNFKGISNIVEADKMSDEYYKKYKECPLITFDNKSSKFVVEGFNSTLSSLNKDVVLENAKNKFGINGNKEYKVEFKSLT